MFCFIILQNAINKPITTRLFGLGFVLIGVAYLVALFGINRLENAVKDQVNKIKE